MADLGSGQCRFACTPDRFRAEQHRFCGEPVTFLRGKPLSWCAEHLRRVSAARGSSPGGASIADREVQQ